MVCCKALHKQNENAYSQRLHFCLKQKKTLKKQSDMEGIFFFPGRKKKCDDVVRKKKCEKKERCNISGNSTLLKEETDQCCDSVAFLI